MNKLGMFTTGCLAGVVFTVAAAKMPVRTLSISALASATTSFITYLVVDTRKQNRLNEAEQKASDNRRNLQKTQGELDSAQVAVKQLTDEATKMKEMLGIAKKGLENYESDSEKSRLAIADLVGRVNNLETELASCKLQLDEKDADIQAMQENFEDIVQEEAQKLAKKAEKTRIQEVFQEHDEITSQAMHLFRQLQGWGMKVQERHQTLKETARELRSQYAKHIDEYTEKVSKEREALLQQIEILNERIGLLQHQLAGDLVEPQYLEAGFDESGRIANALANWLWVNRKIPLKVTGFEQHADGSVTVGYSYSRSVAPESLIKVIALLADCWQQC
jgi:DNA repair exonuclease SbcCD ATPase subunit